MVDVVGVKFRDAGKLYYFDLAGCQVAAGDHVIVETAKGSEYGTVVLAEKQVEEKEVVSPLKKVLRKADEKDEEKHRENLEKRGSALAKCQEKIDKHGLQMKLVDVEYAFDNSKIIFYFTADGRVDFRALVRTWLLCFVRVLNCVRLVYVMRLKGWAASATAAGASAVTSGCAIFSRCPSRWLKRRIYL